MSGPHADDVRGIWPRDLRPAMPVRHAPWCRSEPGETHGFCVLTRSVKLAGDVLVTARLVQRADEPAEVSVVIKEPGRQDQRLRLNVEHLLAGYQVAGELLALITGDLGSAADERAVALDRVDQPALAQFSDGPPHSGPGDAVLLLDVGLGRDPLADPPLAGADAGRELVGQLDVDAGLVVGVEHDDEGRGRSTFAVGPIRRETYVDVSHPDGGSAR